MKKTIHFIFLMVAIILTRSLQVNAQSYHNLYDLGRFSQDWTNTGLITINDNWTEVPSIMGFLGDDATTTVQGIDPRTVVSPFTTIDVIANQTSTNISNAGVAEFQIADPVVALQANATADFPHLIIYINATNCSSIKLKFDIRDIDGTTDNAIQPVALQYRLGNSGNFTNIPGGFVNDATTGPSIATLVTSIDLVLPVECNNQPDLQIRIITANAVGNDEWIGIDNISIENGGDVTKPEMSFNPAWGGTDVPVVVNPVITFNEPVRLADGTEITNANMTSVISEINSYGENFSNYTSYSYTATIDVTKTVITIYPTTPFNYDHTCTIMIEKVEDESGNESIRTAYGFRTMSPPPPSITVTYPNGGEKLYSGDTEMITWNTVNLAPEENVRIDLWGIDQVSGVYEWIEITASTLNDGEFEVMLGPGALYGSDYKVKISTLTNSATDESNGSFTVISSTSDLADLRGYPENTIIKYTGDAVVTYSRTENNQKFIQDSTAAVLINDPSGYITGTYTTGDGITNVEGKITFLNSLLELVPQGPTGEKITVETFIPEFRTLASLTSEDQSKLIKIGNLKFASPSGNFMSSTDYALEGATISDYAFRTLFSEADYIGEPILINYFNAVVLVGQFNAKIIVTPRNKADITLLSSAKTITSFVFDGFNPVVTGMIDEISKMIFLTVPYGTDLSTLIPSVEVSAGALLSPLSGIANDFRSPVIYTVTAEDGTQVDYTVSISVITRIESTPASKIHIYPTPISDHLNIVNIQHVTLIEIFDIGGKPLMIIRNVDSNEINLPLEMLAPGLYFIKLTTANGQILKRFIKS